MKYAARPSVALVCLALAAACAQPAPPPAPAAPAAPVQSPVERGKYLVSSAGCHDCHTPHIMGPNGPEPDMSRMLSGHPEGAKITKGPKLDMPWGAAVTADMTAWSGPWGVSYTANLTPDQNTGLGNWTEDMFVKAIREGKHMGTSRPILPPMPWPAFRNFTDEDLKAIFAYLKSIPPVTNHVPDPIIAEAPAKK
jgi:mono/diheme cytochrome c family protein